MKKLICCIIGCLLLCSAAMADNHHEGRVVMAQPSYWNDLDSVAADYDSHEENVSQTCYVTVTIKQDNANGTTTESTLTVPAYRIEYQFEVFSAKDNTTQQWYYTGVRLALADYPKLWPIENPTRPVDLVLTKGTPPHPVDMICNENLYSLTVQGGSYTLTYNSVLHYDQYGNLIPENTVRTTKNRAYYFVFSGP